MRPFAIKVASRILSNVFILFFMLEVNGVIHYRDSCD